MEKERMNKKLREHRMRADIQQTRRENNFILEKFEQSKRINMSKCKKNSSNFFNHIIYHSNNYCYCSNLKV